MGCSDHCISVGNVPQSVWCRNAVVLFNNTVNRLEYSCSQYLNVLYNNITPLKQGCSSCGEIVFPLLQFQRVELSSYAILSLPTEWSYLHVYLQFLVSWTFCPLSQLVLSLMSLCHKLQTVIPYRASHLPLASSPSILHWEFFCLWLRTSISSMHNALDGICWVWEPVNVLDTYRVGNKGLSLYYRQSYSFTLQLHIVIALPLIGNLKFKHCRILSRLLAYFWKKN